MNNIMNILIILFLWELTEIECSQYLNPKYWRSDSSSSSSSASKNNPAIFKQKLRFLHSELMKLPTSDLFTYCKVHRENIFDESFETIMSIKDAVEIRQIFRVRFASERGVDDGGLLKEWFSLLSKEMFSPERGFFKPNDQKTVEINPLKLPNVQNLRYFEFIGRVTAMAIYKGVPLNVTFSRCLFKNMLNLPIELKDLKFCDPDLHKSLLWFQSNDINAAGYTFIVDERQNGRVKTHKLVPGGESKEVNENNKNEYISLRIERKYVKRIKRQMFAFMKGFKFIVPVDLIKKFNPEELELLICGTQIIDLDDWKRHTKYVKCDKDFYIVHWFWHAIESFRPEEKRNLLEFVTGVPRLPPNGFKDVGFKISLYSDMSVFGYPEGRTCSNTLILPMYENYDDFRRKLKTAIKNPNREFSEI